MTINCQLVGLRRSQPDGGRVRLEDSKVFGAGLIDLKKDVILKSFFAVGDMEFYLD